MKKGRNLIIWLVTPIFLLGMVGIVTGQIIYVDVRATGANNGSSWLDAHNYLQDGLAIAVSGNEIWVARGVYKPDQGVGIVSGDRMASFQLKNGVTIYGGFTGMETSNDQRDWQANETILSGDIGMLSDNSDNSIHVVVGSGTDSTAVLDGFTITAGLADGEGYPNFMGAGMLNHQGSPSIANCLFIGNCASTGGGMFNRDSNILIINCCFIANSVLGDGGGMGNDNWVSYSNRPTIINCFFRNNWAGKWGGAMENYICGTRLINCTFSGNSAGKRGGVMFNQGTMAPRITNCSFIGNSAGERGGVMYNYPNCIPTVMNCILWNNTAPIGAQIDYYLQGPIVKYSDVQGGWTGEGNINADPSYVQSGYWDADGMWVEGDYHLSPDSPCIDTGTNSALGLPGYDAEGNPRIVDGDHDGIAKVDMGVYEHQGIIEVVIDIKPGSHPNSINLGDKGLLPIAILGSMDLDVGEIDPETVEIGGITLAERGSAKAPKLAFSYEDVNSDGYLDIMTFFEMQTLASEGILTESTTALTIMASLYDNISLEGTDSVNIVH